MRERGQHAERRCCSRQRRAQPAADGQQIPGLHSLLRRVNLECRSEIQQQSTDGIRRPCGAGQPERRLGDRPAPLAASAGPYMHCRSAPTLLSPRLTSPSPTCSSSLRLVRPKSGTAAAGVRECCTHTERGQLAMLWRLLGGYIQGLSSHQVQPSGKVRRRGQAAASRLPCWDTHGPSACTLARLR